MPRVPLIAPRCAVCGGAEVETDLVFDGTPLVLAECPRCHHRWTERPRAAAAPAVRAPAPARPAATAA